MFEVYILDYVLIICCSQVSFYALKCERDMSMRKITKTYFHTRQWFHLKLTGVVVYTLIYNLCEFPAAG